MSPDSIADIDETMKSKIDVQRNMTFKTPPIKFRPDKKNRMEIEMDRQIRKHKINIPVMSLAKSRYLIGTQIATCEQIGENVYVRKSPQKPLTLFEDYVNRNHHKFESKLTKYMVWHKQPLTWVVTQLSLGRKFKRNPNNLISTTLENNNTASNGSETKYDSTDSKLLENFSSKVNLNNHNTNEITPYKKIAGEKRDDQGSAQKCDISSLDSSRRRSSGNKR